MSAHADRSFRLFALALLLALLAENGACRKAGDANRPDSAAPGNDGPLLHDGSDAGTDAEGSNGGDGSLASSADTPGDDRGGSDGGMGDLRFPDAYTTPDLVADLDTTVGTDVTMAFWPADFVAGCTPPAINGRQQNDGHHHAGENCMTSGCHLDPELAAHHEGTDCRGSGCHANGSPDGSGAPAFYFGGTIYRAVSLVAAPAVQVAVKTAEGFSSACSATNGNFWSLAPGRTSPALTWSSAAARARNAEGEAVMTTALTAGCNAALCHSGTQRLTLP